MDMSMVTTAAPSPTQPGMIPNCRRWMKSKPTGDTCWEFASRAQDSLSFFLSLNPFLGANGENCPTLFWPNYYYCINSNPTSNGAVSAPTTLVTITPTPMPAPASNPTTPTPPSVKEPEKAAAATATAAGSVTNGIYSGPGITYVGCRSGQTFSSALVGVGTIEVKMTVERCLGYCSNLKYPVAGIASGTQCFCAGSTTSEGAADAGAECTTKCGGDDKQMCGDNGGNWSVYTNSTVKAAANPAKVGDYSYLGCYDETAGRALDYNRGLGLTMTLDKCVGDCAAMGKGYASVRSGKQCYCGNAVSEKAPLLREDICGVQCPGNTSQICGGANFASVYKKNTPSKVKERTLGPAGVTVGEDGRPTVVRTLKMVRHDRFGRRNVFPA